MHHEGEATTLDRETPRFQEAQGPDLNLADIATLLWRQKWLISLCALLGLCIGIAYLKAATFKYTVELELIPAQTANTGLSSSLGRLGGLASLAGVSLPSNEEASPFQLYLQSIYSREIAADLVRRPGFAQRIFDKEWNESSGRWQRPSGLRVEIATAVKRLIGVPQLPWAAPNSGRLQDYIEENVTIERNPKSPVVTLRYDHEDPRFGIVFLSALHEAIDANLRRKGLRRSAGNLHYLTAKLATVTVADYRSALIEAIGEQEKQRMMASSPAPYAAEPFGAPAASLRPTKPNALFVILAGAIAGLLAGVAVAVARHFWRRPGSANSDQIR